MTKGPEIMAAATPTSARTLASVSGTADPVTTYL